MYIPYLQNFLGVELTEEEFQDIKHPYVEMYTHVTLKTIQSGTFLGTLLFGPILATAKKETRNIKGLVSKVNKCGKVGAALGFVVGPIMTYKKFLDQSEEAVYDRAYRVRKNRHQLRVDRSYIGGAAIGSTVFTFIMGNPLFGELAGSTVGLLGAAYYNNMYLTSMEDIAKDDKNNDTVNKNGK